MWKLAVVGVLVARTALAAGVGSFGLLAAQHAILHNMRLQGTCNVGVNCGLKQDNSPIGVCILERGAVLYDLTCGQARFRGHDPSPVQVHDVYAMLVAGSDFRNVDIAGALKPYTPTILGDLNGNGKPSCTADGVVDRTDFEAACQFGTPPPATADYTAPAGKITTLAPGTYSYRAFKVGKGATLQAQGVTVYATSVSVADNATIRGPLTLRTRGTEVGFGTGRFDVMLCAPNAEVKTGKNATVHGRWIALEITLGDRNTVICPDVL